MRDNWDLHRRIADIARNPFAQSVYLSAMAHVQGLPSQPDQATADDDQGYLVERVAIHADLVEAIIANDPHRTARAVDAIAR